MKSSESGESGTDGVAGQTGRRTITVVLADSMRLVRAGVQRLFDDHDEIEVVATADDVDNAVRFTNGHHPDLVIIDLPAMARADEHLELINKLSVDGNGKETGIVVLTLNQDPVLARQALGAGVRAYVLKSDAPTELLEATRTAAADGRYVSPKIGASMLDIEGGIEELSDRETEVLRLVAFGFTNVEVAEQMNLSVRTVESHRATIQEKIGANSRADLVRFALDRGLLN